MSLQHARSPGRAQYRPANHPLLADVEYLEDLRRQMLKFATLQLSDVHLAEDAVQDAFAGALKNVDSFGGRSALKTWVFAILKNKIADQLRHRQRMLYSGSLPPDDDDLGATSSPFDKKGFWQSDQRPSAWADPEESMRERQFWRVFDACLNHLPASQARIFMMREFIELEAPEICASIGITYANLNVTLHRARLRLRKCLENNWFLGDDDKC